MTKYYDGQEVAQNVICEDTENWQLDCINPITKVAYYTGVNQAEGLCTIVSLRYQDNCTIEREY